MPIPYTRAIVHAPAESLSQGLTAETLGLPDYSVALAQYQAYVKALEDLDLDRVELAQDVYRCVSRR